MITEIYKVVVFGLLTVLLYVNSNNTDSIISTVKDNGCASHIEMDTTPKTNRSEYRYENLW